MLKDYDITNVKTSISMIQVANAYGYEVNRQGMIRCPFHVDAHPSMKVYDGDKGWHCFVCNKGGDVIDFVREHDNLDFEPAVRRLAGMFGIAISDGKSELSQADRERMERRRKRREAAKMRREANEKRLVEISSLMATLRDMQARYEPLSDLWCAAEDRLISLSIEWEQRFARMK